MREFTDGPELPDGKDAPRSHMRGIVGVKMSGHTVLGAILLTLGVLWTLDNLGLIDSDKAIEFWPIILLAFGVAKINGYNTRRDPAAGTVMVVVAGLLLLKPLGIFHTSVFHLWPLLLIAGGLSLLKRARAPVGARTDGSAEIEDAHFSVLAVMGAAGRRVHSQQFRGAEATALMGGVELDLRSAKAASDTVYVEVFTWWGGIEIVVPRDWKVDIEASPIMGGVVDTTKAPVGPVATTLVVRGIVIMGGVEVKNKSALHPDTETQA